MGKKFKLKHFPPEPEVIMSYEEAQRLAEYKEIKRKSALSQYTDNPRLNNPNDLYYEGIGCTWSIDLDGIRYWKRYYPVLSRKRFDDDTYSHLIMDDIIDEKERIKKIVKECLDELK